MTDLELTQDIRKFNSLQIKAFALYAFLWLYTQYMLVFPSNITLLVFGVALSLYMTIVAMLSLNKFFYIENNYNNFFTHSYVDDIQRIARFILKRK